MNRKSNIVDVSVSLLIPNAMKKSERIQTAQPLTAIIKFITAAPCTIIYYSSADLLLRTRQCRCEPAVHYLKRSHGSFPVAPLLVFSVFYLFLFFLIMPKQSTRAPSPARSITGHQSWPVCGISGGGSGGNSSLATPSGFAAASTS